MRMTPARLILLRLYCLTLGRLSVFSTLLRKMLVSLLITRKQTPYVASSRYFTLDELD